MIQGVTVKVYLEFEVADHSLNDYIDILLSNIKHALTSWAESSETGLCPEEIGGHTDRIVVFIDQVYKPEV